MMESADGARVRSDEGRRRFPVSLGLVGPMSGERWLVGATPAFPKQLFHLERIAPHDDVPGLAGILDVRVLP